MDNQTIDVTSEGREGILHALKIIWEVATFNGKVTHYKVLKLREKIEYYGEPKTTHHFVNLDEVKDGTPTLILLAGDESNATPLPYPLSCEQAAAFIADWLENADYGRQPDHDGDNGKGWRLFTEGWGHVFGHHSAVIGAQPAWAMYGK